MSNDLSYRIEKYIEDLGIERDINSLYGSYVVNSLYFETPFMDDYYDKDASLLVRKKMRARTYDLTWENNMDKRVWLEIKNKRNFHINKERGELQSGVWNKFMDSGSVTDLLIKSGDMKEKFFFERFSYLYAIGRYAPYIAVKYQRTAYLDNFTSKIRITFDRNINTCSAEDAFANSSVVAVTDSETVMEVKFNDQLPWWFQTILSVFDLKRTDFSKYNHSVAKLRDLYRIPINR